MYKVMIVDDVPEIRTGLRLKLDWRSLGFEIAKEASNGKQALAFLEEEAVHVIISDIKMPIMDGLELLQQCTIRFPFIKTIVFSGYNDFPYLQTALRCGAKDYLLKPILTEDLKAVLLKIKKDLDMEKESKLLRFLQKDHAFADTALPSAPFVLDWTESGEYAQFVSIEMRIPPNRLEHHASRPELLRLAFQLLTREVASQCSEYVSAFYDQNWPSMMHFLIRSQEPANEGSDSVTQRLVEQLRIQVNQLLKIEAVIGVGRPVSGLEQWRAGYQSSLLSWSLSSLEIVSQVVHPVLEYAEGDSFDVLQKKLMSAMEQAQEERLFQSIDEMFQASKHATVQSHSFSIIRLCLFLDMIVKKHEIRDPELALKIRTCMDAAWDHEARELVVERIKQASQHIVSRIKEEKSKGGQEAITAIQKYIQTHYSEELSLSSIAHQFHYSVAYLSDLFKKQTGVTFSDYLLDIRMVHARNLLQTSDLKLAEIAQMTGFSNASYFSNVFKSVHGKSPNGYRTYDTSDS